MKKITIAICTYNRCHFLPQLVESLNRQECSIPFDILFIDNNSTDQTRVCLKELSKTAKVPLRCVTETEQGIVPARNRALSEVKDSKYFIFMDDDELSLPGMVEAAVNSLQSQGADCTGGRVINKFIPGKRPDWLEDNLLGFFAETDYGETPFWITSMETPLWTANIAFKTSLFKDGLKFDSRYNRAGKAIGGGEDVIMFQELLRRKVRIRYEPAMAVTHHVDESRFKKRYFLKRHFLAGKQRALYEDKKYKHEVAGIPPFMFLLAIKHFLRALMIFLRKEKGVIRQCMNLTHGLGMIYGSFLKSRNHGDYMKL